MSAAPALIPAETYKSPAQTLRERQASIKAEAYAEVDSLLRRLAGLTREATDLGQLDVYPKELRQALSQFAAAAESSARIVTTHLPKA